MHRTMAGQGKSVQHRAPGAHLARPSSPSFERTKGPNVYAIILPAHIGSLCAAFPVSAAGQQLPSPIAVFFFRLQNAIIVIDFAQFPMLKTVVKTSQGWVEMHSEKYLGN